MDPCQPVEIKTGEFDMDVIHTKMRRVTGLASLSKLSDSPATELAADLPGIHPSLQHCCRYNTDESA